MVCSIDVVFVYVVNFVGAKNYLVKTFNKDIFLIQDIFSKNRNIFFEDKRYLDYRVMSKQCTN